MIACVPVLPNNGVFKEVGDECHVRKRQEGLSKLDPYDFICTVYWIPGKSGVSMMPVVKSKACICIEVQPDVCFAESARLPAALGCQHRPGRRIVEVAIEQHRY